MRAHRDMGDPGGHLQLVQVAGEGLFRVMRMVQDSRPQHGAIRAQSLDAVGVTVPARVLAADGDIQVVESRGTPPDRHMGHVRVPGPGQGDGSGEATREHQRGQTGATPAVQRPGPRQGGPGPRPIMACPPRQT